MTHWSIRNVLLAVGLVMSTSSVVLAQDARATAEAFVDGLLDLSGSRDVTAMEAYLRENIDTDYGFEVAFRPVTGVVSSAQRERLSALMLRFIARESVVIGTVGRGGDVSIVGTSESQLGTMVEMVYRDDDGDYPFGVLVGPNREGGRLLIRDVGSPRQSSVVSNLTYATQSLAQASPDADVWISAFEDALGQ